MDYVDIGFQCGEKIMQILKEIPPGEITIKSPRKVLYWINMKTVEHIKLDLPETLIKSAYEVY